MSNSPASSHGLSLQILMVEDHEDLREMFIEFLGRMGHAVIGCSVAEELDEHLTIKMPDLLILDLILPGEDGYSIAKRIRQAHPDLYILMLTARTAIVDRVQGYVCGADIYLTKPVDPEELAVVVGNIARRLRSEQQGCDQLCIDTNSLELSGPDGTQVLMPVELKLIKCLAEANEQQLPYWRLHEILELEIDEKGKHALEARISRLKKKLHSVGSEKPALKSIWKEGYRLCTGVRFLT
jgi:DNA-binding response OmpR family regulator